MKVGAVAFPLTRPGDFAAWEAEALRWLAEAKAQRVELLVFPEYMTLALETSPGFAEWFGGSMHQLFSAFARQEKCIVLGGSHSMGQNVAVTFFPDGQVVRQEKIHLIPSEPTIKAGSQLKVLPFQHGKFATTICYDVEFPELTRAAVKAGTNLLLCPSWTERSDGFHRVRYCALARAVENQLFVVHAPLVGSLKAWGVDEEACGSAAILAPCDPAFPANGILSEGPWSQSSLVTAELDFRLLHEVRQNGAVRTYRDFMSAKKFEVTPSLG